MAANHALSHHTHTASTGKTCETALLHHCELLAQHQVRLATGSLMHDLRDADSSVPTSSRIPGCFKNQASAIPRRSCLSLRWSFEGKTCRMAIAAAEPLCKRAPRQTGSRPRGLCAPCPHLPTRCFVTEHGKSHRHSETVRTQAKSEGRQRSGDGPRSLPDVAKAHEQPNAVKRPSISWYEDHRFREHSSRLCHETEMSGSGWPESFSI